MLDYTLKTINKIKLNKILPVKQLSHNTEELYLF